MDGIIDIILGRSGYLGYALPLVLGWVLDRLLGDPARLPHPVVGFGKAISFFERRLNRWRTLGAAELRIRGAVVSAGLTALVFAVTFTLLSLVSSRPVLRIALCAAGVFYCLAGTTLAREVRMVFEACDRSPEEGRRQVGRIVGRDTASLSGAEVRTAALETLAENLSDGVVAPLFWYMLLGLPGMMAYKMINTLDSMIGYRSERYRCFGCFAARMDDVANWIPARITAFMIAVATGRARAFGFIRKYGRCHASPNSGYPESALAGALDCRFGGTHDYFGKAVYKPYIGSNPRELATTDMTYSVKICTIAEIMSVALALLVPLPFIFL